MPNYGDPKYWEDRYKNSKGSFDWLEDYESLKPTILKLNLSKEAKILNLGCGNSPFCEDMYEDGFHNISNIDISNNAIEIMKNRNEKRKEMTFEVMDVRNLKFKDSSIDLAVDKSTIDALLCGNSSYINVAKMLKEVQRVLKVGGYYMAISYGEPQNRVVHFQRKFLKFDIETIKIEKKGDDTKIHYIYLCKKLEGADDISKKFFSQCLKELDSSESFKNDLINQFSDKKKIHALAEAMKKKP